MAYNLLEVLLQDHYQSVATEHHVCYVRMTRFDIQSMASMTRARKHVSLTPRDILIALVPRMRLETCLHTATAEVFTGLAKTTSGFGGITRGVIQAASISGKRRAPVMRLEELHQVLSPFICTPCKGYVGKDIHEPRPAYIGLCLPCLCLAV